MKCRCGHRKNCHYYVPLIGDNTGRCLCINCDCRIFERDE